MRTLEREYGAIPEPVLERAAAQADFLVVAVRPDAVMALLEKTRQTGSLQTKRKNAKGTVLACSLAAGIPFAKLRAALGPPVRWARAMPSPAGRTGRGLTAVTFARDFPKAGRGLVKSFFGKVGPVVVIPQSQFDAFTVTYSSSHGYYALAALARAAQKLGLDRKTASVAATHALADGILAWRDGRVSLEALLQEAATPGGIAASVMETMDRHGHAKVVERGLRAGLARARKNARR